MKLEAFPPDSELLCLLILEKGKFTKDFAKGQLFRFQCSSLFLFRGECYIGNLDFSKKNSWKFILESKVGGILTQNKAEIE